MGLTWHRNVTVEEDDDGKKYLRVSIPPQGNPQGKNDPPNKITIEKDDRLGDAKVIYTLTGQNGTLGCKDKEQRPPGFHDASAGNKLTITDEESAPGGVTFSYYVTLGAIKTKDPLIHNPATGRG